MLDVFFRKYAWIANAALLVASAWLSARTVNTVAAAAIRPRPQVDLVASPPAAPAGPQVASLETNRLYPLFGLKPPEAAPPGPAPAAAPPPSNCSSAAAQPVKSGLRAQLVAGVVADRPEFSIASILDLTTRETHIYGVGDAFQGATLLGVRRMSDPRDGTGSGFKVVAVLCNAGKKEFLDFEPGEASPGPPPLAVPGAPVPGPNEPGAAVDLAGVRKTAENRYEIPRRVLDQSLSNLNNLATQARIVPSFRNGVANGFKLFSIQPGSLYAAIGIENGDVVQRINGYEINSPDKALEIYQKLREASLITVELERNGVAVRKDYNINAP